MSSDLSLATASRRELRNLAMTTLLVKAPACLGERGNLRGQKIEAGLENVNMLRGQRGFISSWS